MHLLSRFRSKASTALLLLVAQVVSQTVPSPNLDIKSLGEVTLAGDFDAISLYTSSGQKEGFNGNGTQSILSQLPTGAFDILSSTDAGIEALCPLVVNSTLMGIVVAGNFTSVGGVAARSLAWMNATTLEVQAIGGVQGTVSALYCDDDNSMLYVGGAFDAGNSTNAIGWAAGGWSSLPFAGFDGPVSSITKAPNGHIIFGGSFTGLGNISSSSLKNPESQVINLSTANVTARGNTSTAGLGDPRNIVCPSNSSDGSSDFLLADNTAGSWSADLAFGFEPTKLRLWQTSQSGKGTKTWRFTAHPLDGILNFTTTDPATGDLTSCSSTCPLAEYNASQPYQDFYFVNLVGMNSFTIDISAWYGDGAGLGGIELFQTDIFSYAIEAFNEPTCETTGIRSEATATGSWYTTPSRESVSDYLTVVVGPTTVDTTLIVFEPDVQQSGNYSVIVYTPGCLQDSSCSARAIVNVTGSLTEDGKQSFGTTIFQTNDFDKYDIVYQGYVDATTTSFRPSVTLRPSGQQAAQLVVASRVKFGFTSTTGGLNGLFDYDPNNHTIDYATADFSKSAINNAGTTLKPNANVLALATRDNTIYAAGRFSDDVFENIMAFHNNSPSSLPDGGLNAAVNDMYSLDDFLYVGGNFTNTAQGNVDGLSNVAAYQYSKDAWVPLGAGLDGPVEAVEPMQLNISQSGGPETVIAFSGSFTRILASGSNSVSRVGGLAIWVPSKSGWLANLDVPKEALAGQLYAATFLPNQTWLGAGTLNSLGMAISGAAGLQSQSGGQVALSRLPVDITPSDVQSSTTKRAVQVTQNVTGVTTGLYYTGNGQNVTIMGGHFTATATGGSIIENLMFLNGSNNNRVSGPPAGMDASSTVLALGLSENILFAGGTISGRVENTDINGLVLYDMSAAAYRAIQPASLQGDNNVAVNAIAPRSGTTAVYVGGSFDRTSQDLSCPVVCMYDTSTSQWNTVGTGLQGTVSSLFWRTGSDLLAAGDLKVQGNQTSLANYNTGSQTWSVYDIAGIPGPVTAFCPATTDANQMWVAGTANNGSTFLVEIDGINVRPVADAFDGGTTIRGLQIMPLTKDHGSTPYLDNDYALLVTGQLKITGFGNAAAALFNGTHMEPFVLASTADGSPGSIAQVFSSHTNVLRSSEGGHSLGIVILVALCAALGTIFLIILIGIILNYIQRKRAGYKSVPSVPYTDKHSNIHRVPPEALLGNLGSKPGVPAV
ncbi:uncharacterized protein Z520_04065 [Fonsecaea multimorphosa CBS 102226]|uniref:Cellular morphogenesis protein n=1 Tax=Fonsecaea multimorphosa CBS 102226 TaxID=1442371 RepID=A0A0D2KB72_9EURO|nr:uncharacterized protein Z520_04065 [Fonsecaea multimorphosa CBS 102226]KIY00380.1 hypothetical protein Z520_04065 [Fonsecaea multimorphosa CBS 102226]OAL27211.1 hypothetical protein AYO22_03842 [Fonsecaea multimorphosa]